MGKFVLFCSGTALHGAGKVCRAGKDTCLKRTAVSEPRNSKSPVPLLKAFKKSVNSPGGSDSTDFLNNAEAQETNCF